MRDFQYAYSEGGAVGLTGAIVGQILGQFFGSMIVGFCWRVYRERSVGGGSSLAFLSSNIASSKTGLAFNL